jgi:hypothetical protein
MPALEIGPSPASPLPDDAVTLQSRDGTPAGPSTNSSRSAAAPVKPPPASLVSVTIKGKRAGPAKSGDLTRLFELARRNEEAPPAAGEPASEPPPAPATGLEASPQPAPAAGSPIETSAAEDMADSTPTGPPPATMPIEDLVSLEPTIFPQPMLEPSIPPMLAPSANAAIEDATLPRGPATPGPASPAEAAVVALPDWVTATTDRSDVASKTTEPLEATLVPLEPPSLAMEAGKAAQDEVRAAPEIAAAPIPEPAPSPVDPPPVTEPSPVAVAPVEPLLAPVPAPPPMPAFKELVDYWRWLRRGDGHPAAAAVDRELVTERWPGTLLIAYTPVSQDPRGEPRPGRVTRLGPAGAEIQSVVDAGSHSTEWMLEVARTALVNDEPVEEQQRLETVSGAAGFRMVALPLGPPKALADAVLCALVPSSGAPRFGKRRTWL